MLDPVARKIIAELAKERPDWTYKSIAGAFGCSEAWVCEMAIAAGVRRKPKTSPEQITRMVADYEAGTRTIGELAERYGMGKRTYQTKVKSATRFRRNAGGRRLPFSVPRALNLVAEKGHGKAASQLGLTSDELYRRVACARCPVCFDVGWNGAVTNVYGWSIGTRKYMGKEPVFDILGTTGAHAGVPADRIYFMEGK